MSEDQLGAAIRSAAVRGVVTQSRIGPRTLLLVTGLDGEVANVVELLLPPGYSARPAQGADILLHQILGSRDHLVASGGDTAGQAIPDLQPGEFGMRDANGQQLVFRLDHIEMTTPAYVQVNAPLLKVSGDIIDNFATNPHNLAQMRAIYNGHTHGDPQGGSTSPPSATQ
ncbi:MAG: phage baseplate assembly protein [Acetobacteraceae bacterium]|nr:phage baseplate assembly protein [Acetobacteraceae bacterium]